VSLSLPRPRPPRSAMQGSYGRLEPTSLAHVPALYRAFAVDGGAGDWTYLPYGPFASETTFADWVSAACLGEDPLFHTIFDRDGTALGMASYLRIDPANASIEVGHIHFSPALQRTALATEAMALMMARAFDELGYRRYEWKCDALNAPSRAAAERLGFTFEGIFRQASVVKGRNRDTAWFSVLDSEWPRIKDRFAHWLAPQNFDAAGQQIAALR
uniref:GNAT family N-acetyltransferase n=1 Tax=Puniceibacterium confluentis TaxID=1958944 RepID=UPI0035679B6A